MPEGPIDDAEALQVINNNYAKCHMNSARYDSLLEWANGLDKKSPNEGAK